MGYDGLKRVVLHRHLRQDNSLIAGFAHDYDRADNKLFEIKQHDNNRKEDYTYDSIYRLGRFSRQDEPEDTWALDGVGTWASRKGEPNQTNNLNEYTSFAGVPQLHDDNGSLIDDGTNRYQYDFANRLRKINRKSDNAVIAVYRYDAHNRRNERIVTNTTSLDERVRYLYDGWQEFEEQRANSTQQYVYGIWIDEPLTLDKDANNDGSIDQTLFYQQDGKTYVAALTNRTDGVVDQVTYDAYGQPSPREGSAGNPYLFTGRRFDPETGFYYYRARYYDLVHGRFIQRDSLRYVDGINLYEYVRGNPVNALDPSGLKILICNRKVTGGPAAAVGNHAYFWNTKDNSCCGMSSSSGSGTPTTDCKEAGPAREGNYGPFDACHEVADSEGKEDALMRCCNKTANSGIWIPWLNDCHVALEDCCIASKLKFPGAPGGRLGDPKCEDPECKQSLCKILWSEWIERLSMAWKGRTSVVWMFYREGLFYMYQVPRYGDKTPIDM